MFTTMIVISKKTDATYLDYDTFKKYKKYLVGKKWDND